VLSGISFQGESGFIENAVIAFSYKTLCPILKGHYKGIIHNDKSICKKTG